MTIDWTDIASCEELEKLYRGMSVNTLAKHLGVGYETCRQRLIKCGVKFRNQGGTRYKFARENLPENATDMSTGELVKLTGFTHGHCRKIRRNLRRQRDEEKRKG